jgi:hypothetical protein
VIEVAVDFDKKKLQFRHKEENVGEVMSFADFTHPPILLASICNAINLDIVFPQQKGTKDNFNPKSEKTN